MCSPLNSEVLDLLDYHQKFRAKLENHLLSRIIHEQDHRNFPSFDEVKRQKLRIKNDRIYTHKRVWIHFTSYDVRRDRDVINLASGKQDVMFTSSDTNHPFAYARVMGIFHVDAEYPSVPLKRYNLLWVRWFAAVPADPSSQGYNPLDKLGIQKDEDFCYGFADPANVVRACHLIPAWHHGTIRNDFDCPPESGASNTCTYRYYYINK